MCAPAAWVDLVGECEQSSPMSVDPTREMRSVRPSDIARLAEAISVLARGARMQLLPHNVVAPPDRSSDTTSLRDAVRCRT
jgi:hypothetical protein